MKGTPARRERRRSRRTRLYGFSAINATAGVQVVVRDVGVDSFAVESPVPSDVGTSQEFLFTNYGLTTTVTGVVRRCERFAQESSGPRYIVGFTALYKTAADHTVVAGCVDVLNGSTAARAQR